LDHNPYYYEWYYDYSVIYIPDEYINEESIAILDTEFSGFTDENIGNNLFVFKHPPINE
jgi:hypothetical protein